jgi:glycosyltransferase involved in cell wall biosynthesis
MQNISDSQTASSHAAQSPAPSLGCAVPVSVVVLTKNEERNLRGCLESVAGWCREIFIVDSGSDDATIPIAEHYGAAIVAHPFESHTKQWNWALTHLPFCCEWVLCLDADQRVTPELRAEIGLLLAGGTVPQNGLYVKRRQIFRGRWIKHGGYYPKYLLKMVRHKYAWCDENERLDSHFYVEGSTGLLKHDIIEDNQNENDITFWIDKHNRYAIAQASEELHRQNTKVEWSLRPKFFGTPDQRTLFLRGIWYRHLPLYVRPFLLFFYRYFLRLGFLDGKEGLIFHFCQSLWFRLLVDVKIEELQRSGTVGAESDISASDQLDCHK